MTALLGLLAASAALIITLKPSWPADRPSVAEAPEDPLVYRFRNPLPYRTEVTLTCYGAWEPLRVRLNAGPDNVVDYDIREPNADGSPGRRAVCVMKGWSRR